MGNNLDFATSYLTKTVLKGVRNAEAVQAPKESTRLVFTLPLLKILGHCLMSQDWDPDSKRIFWAASTLLFFGSFRVSEILSKNEYSYDPLTTLVWSDVLQVGEALRIHVKFPKVFSAKGIFVDLFPVDDVTICPVHCLKNLRLKVKNQDEPVFKFGTGKLLTPTQFNKSLKDLLGTVLTPEENQFTSHSFRAAIPAALEENPDIASKQELKMWGRWDSNAYLKYTRLQYEQRKITFHSICKMFIIRPASLLERSVLASHLNEARSTIFEEQSQYLAPQPVQPKPSVQAIACGDPGHTVLFGRIGLEHWGVYDVTITILHQLSFTYFFEINLSLLGLSV
jgi:hypothetical protein